jgi:hypothetical protein
MRPVLFCIFSPACLCSCKAVGPHNNFLCIIIVCVRAGFIYACMRGSGRDHELYLLLSDVLYNSVLLQGCWIFFCLLIIYYFKFLSAWQRQILLPLLLRLNFTFKCYTSIFGSNATVLNQPHYLKKRSDITFIYSRRCFGLLFFPIPL